MLTIDVAPRTEARIKTFLVEMEGNGYPPDEGLAPVYVMIRLASLLGMEISQLLPLLRTQAPVSLPHRNAEAAQATNEAVDRLKEMHVRYRNRSVEAIARKNSLTAQIDLLVMRFGALEKATLDSLRAGDGAMARRNLAQARKDASELRRKQAELAQAAKAADFVKEQMRQEQERLQERTAEALATVIDTPHAARPVGFVPTGPLLYHLDRPLSARSRTSEGEPETGEEPQMRLELDLPENVEAVVRHEAERRGLSREAFVAKIMDGLSDLADLVTPQPQQTQAADAETPSGPPQETIESIIDETLLELRENQIQRRERIVKVITQKNNLASDVDKRKAFIPHLERKSLEALAQGNRNLALAFYRTRALAFRYGTKPPTIATPSSSELEAQFDQWVATCERQAQMESGTYAPASPTADVETRLNRLEEMLNQPPDTESNP